MKFLDVCGEPQQQTPKREVPAAADRNRHCIVRFEF